MNIEIEWDKVNYFEPDEFSEDPDKYADPALIYSLDIFREMLQYKIYPSPVTGALARFDDGKSGSRHYAVSRKSDAIDIFCNTSILEAWTIAIRSGLWKGIGVYFDTFYRNRDWCMLHLDNRSTNLLWYRDNHEYSFEKDRLFWEKLSVLLGES